MIVPPEVAERAEEMSDDEIVAAFVANGETEGYARACLEAIRGRRPQIPGLPDTLS